MLKAQDPFAIHIDKTKGLPSNEVYNIFQDSKGFIWIGNNDGLTRYDGFEFKTYKCKEQTSVAGSYINEDIYGRIWYENFDGYLYYVENDSLKALKQKKTIGFSYYGLINNKIFTTSENAIDVYDIKNMQLVKSIKINTKTSVNNQFTNKHFYEFNTYLLRFDEQLKMDTICRIANTDLHFSHSAIPSKKGLILYNRLNPERIAYELINKTITKKFSLPEINFIQSACYTDSCYWFCSPSGVYGIKENGTALNNNKAYFSNKSISCVLKDREGNFWFSTLNDGIYFVPDISNVSTKTPYTPFRLRSHQNTLLVGTTTNEIIEFNPQNGSNALIYKGKDNKEISLIHPDTLSGHLFFQAINFNDFIGNKQILSKPIAIKDLARLDEKYYAISASGLAGLYKYNDDKNIVSIWDEIFEKQSVQYPTNLPFVPIISIVRAKSVVYQKNNQVIYYATNNGLFKVTPSDITEIKDEGKTLFINKLQNYNSDIYCLSTKNELLKLWGDSLFPLSLPNNYSKIIHKIKVIKNYLFIITDKEFVSYNLIRHSFSKLNINPQYVEINDIELISDTLYVASNQQLIKYNLYNTHNFQAKPLFHINYVKTNGKSISGKDLLELSPDQNNIDINYSILSFKTDFSFPLYYSVNDGKWVLTSLQSRNLVLSSLAPGKYKIQFRLGGNIDTKSTTLEFFITKPFYQTWWFIVIVIIAIVFIVASLAIWRIKELQQKNKLLSEKYESEQKYYRSTLKAIRAQMNPHFFYNALNTIQSFIFSDDKRNASTYLAKFSKLTRLILEMSEKEINSVTEEITALQLYLDIEKVRFNDDFNYEIITPENWNSNETFIPPMIIQPYVENAIKHGLLHKKGPKVLSIEFDKKENSILVTIDDNGIGRKMSMQLNEKKLSKHQSFSTAANKQRLDILNKENDHNGVLFIDKTDDAGNSTGTKVILNIPITWRH